MTFHIASVIFPTIYLVLVLIVVGTLHLGSGTLSLFHGRLSGGVTLKPVQGVLALNLGGARVSQFVDCNGTQNNAANLRWRKDSAEPRFQVQVRTSEVRLDLSTAELSDEGIYVCMDIVTGDSVSINISGAPLAINPAEAVVSVPAGSPALLHVYFSFYMGKEGNTIIWSNPKQQMITTTAALKYVLANGNSTLRIASIRLEDSGIYSISIQRRIAGMLLHDSTVIILHIQVPATLVSSLRNISVLEHEDVTQTCIFDGNPKPVITWQREGGSLPVVLRTNTQVAESRNDSTGVFTVNSSYTIFGVLTEDAGKYRCSANSTIYTTFISSEYAHLQVTPRLLLTATVNSLSTLIPETSVLSISNGSTVSVTCRGSGVLMWSSASGTVIPLVTAFPTSNNIYQRRDTSSNTQDLVIAHFGSKDQNQYTCSRNTATGQIVNSILLAGSLAIYISLPVVYTSLGADANITAAFVGSGPITWMFNGQTINSTINSRYTTVTTPTSQTLQVHNVGSDVLGTYTVMISSGGDTQMDTIELIIIPVHPNIEVTELIAMLSSTQLLNIKRQNGDPGVILSCQSEGFPEPTITWSRAGGLPTEVTSTRSNSRVLLEWNRNMKYTDSGVYLCNAHNNAGFSMATVQLLVTVAPYVTSISAISPVQATSDSSFSVPRGYSGSVLNCSGFAYPPPRIVWTAAGEMPTRVSSSTATAHAPYVSARLVLSNFGEKDVGNYKCIVHAQDGSDRSDEDIITLTLTKPSPKSNCIFHSVNFIISIMCVMLTLHYILSIRVFT